MSCCAQGASAGAELLGAPSPEEIMLASRDLGVGLRQSDLSVPGIRCAHCIGAIESAFRRVDGVETARVNLSSKRVAVKWRGGKPPPIIETLRDLGYEAHLFTSEDRSDPELARLIRAMALAGFCSMNIMLLSVSIWSGAEADTRQAFHWISAGLALPALIYSGRIFFLSAWSALKRWRTNMDVPISIGVILAFALSLYDTVTGGPHAYFDAASSLLFFLLIGRVLDHLMRAKARSAVSALVQLTPRGATVIRADGSRDYLPASAVEPGMLLHVAPGDRLLVDGVVEAGQSDVDCSLATGETRPQTAAKGDRLRSGMLNLTGALVLRAQSSVANSFVAEMAQLMEAAEGSRSHYRRLADRAAGYYAPAVHGLALLTLVGWLIATGDWYRSISIAIAVLIITCPCALGLAVPIVQAVAARRLFESGIMVKDGGALERLAEVDQVALDKTGTLTLGRPRLLDAGSIDARALGIAVALAQQSNHPLCRALALHGSGRTLKLAKFTEHPGCGIEAWAEGHHYRLGRASWARGCDTLTSPPSPLRGRESHMRILKVSGAPAMFPLSRCEAMGEGGRRPGEGSSCQQGILVEIGAHGAKEPSSALRAPSPIASQREKVSDGEDVRIPYAIPFPATGNDGESAARLGTEAEGEEGTVLSEDGKVIATLAFEDDPRAGTPDALARLRAMGLRLRILSGDAPSVVRRIADGLGIDEAIGGMLPKEKTNLVASLGKVLMVGDGLNDAPALARAHASMAPASAADIGRNAADFVFLHGSLTAVPLAIRIARDARRLVGQNFALAIGYNVLALPFAIAGGVTPLLAALAMSASSIVVVANALRLRGARA